MASRFRILIIMVSLKLQRPPRSPRWCTSFLKAMQQLLPPGHNNSRHSVDKAHVARQSTSCREGTKNWSWYWIVKAQIYHGSASISILAAGTMNFRLLACISPSSPFAIQRMCSNSFCCFLHRYKLIGIAIFVLFLLVSGTIGIR